MWRKMILFVLSAALGAAGGAFWKSRAAAAGSAVAGASSGGSAETGDAAGKSPKAAGAPASPSKTDAAPPPSREELRAAAEKDRLPLLVRWLAAADAAQIGALAKEWFPEGKDGGDVLWQVLAARWVELDAPAAVAYGRKLAEDVLRKYPGSATPLNHVYAALAKRDRNLALSFLASEPPDRIGNVSYALDEILGPAAVRDWALAQPGRPELDSLRHRDLSAYASVDLKNPAESAARLSPAMLQSQGEMLAQSWVKTDPASALAWANSLESGPQRTKILAAVAVALAGSDPEKAREIIQSLPPGAPQANAGAAYAAALAKKDPENAQVWVRANLNGAARLQGLVSIAGVQADKDPAAALRMLRENRIGDLVPLLTTRISSPVQFSMGYAGDSTPLTSLFKTLSARDPAGTMQLLADTNSLLPKPGWLREGMDDQGYDGSVGRGVLKDWAARDPAAAARWTASQPGSDVMTGLARSVAEAWFSKNPADLQAFAGSLPAGPGRDQFVGLTASLLSAQNPAGALDWAAAAGGGEALGTVFGTVARTNPALAAARFASLPEAQQSSQLQTLTDSLGKAAPAEAVRFLQSLPEAQQSGVQLRETAIAYARQDPEAASQWIGALPPTEAKDTAISGLVDYLIRQSSDPDPEAAAHWAAASVTEAGRGRRLERVAQAWFQRDPDGAAAAIEATTLASEIKQTLLRHAPVKK